MDREQRKKAIADYKQKVLRAGVYRILNTKTGWFLVMYSADLDSVHNKYAFGAEMGGGAWPPQLRKGFEGYGYYAMKIEELDMLEVKPEQTREEVRAELEELAELWKEKLSQKS